MFVSSFYTILIWITRFVMSLNTYFLFHFVSIFSNCGSKKVVGSHANLVCHVFEVFVLSLGKCIVQAQPIDLYKKFFFKYFSTVKANVAGLMANIIIVLLLK